MSYIKEGGSNIIRTTHFQSKKEIQMSLT
jgi:hypothetical protein